MIWIGNLICIEIIPTNTSSGFFIGKLKDIMDIAEVLIIGAGAQAKYVTDTISYLPKFRVAGIIDTESNPKMHGKEINGAKIVGGLEYLNCVSEKTVKLILAHSSNQRKEELAKMLSEKGFQFTAIVHPAATISKYANIGEGAIINAGAVIQSAAKIGRFVMIHANCVVEHDSVLEDFVNLAPGVILAGHVHVKKGAYVYTGSKVIPKVTIGKNAVVGAGAVVLKDVPEAVTVVGAPAKAILKK